MQGALRQAGRTSTLLDHAFIKPDTLSLPKCRQHIYLQLMVHRRIIPILHEDYVRLDFCQSKQQSTAGWKGEAVKRFPPLPAWSPSVPCESTFDGCRFSGAQALEGRKVCRVLLLFWTRGARTTHARKHATVCVHTCTCVPVCL